MAEEQKPMRPQIKDAVEKAINEAILEQGGMPQGFMGVVAYLTADGVEKFALIASDHLGMIQLTGMAEMMHIEQRAANLKHLGW